MIVPDLFIYYFIPNCISKTEFIPMIIVLQKLLMNVRTPEFIHKHRISLRRRTPPSFLRNNVVHRKSNEDLKTVKFISEQHYIPKVINESSNYYNHYKSFVSMQHRIPKIKIGN